MTYYADDTVTLHLGDAATVLATLPAGSVDCVVTSPPYFGLRNYGVPGQIGAETSPAEYVAALVAVFAQIRRVLADDGVAWLNLGDSYATHDPGGYRVGEFLNPGGRNPLKRTGAGETARNRAGTRAPGITPKNLLGIPWRVAFALQDDGWILRNDVCWNKPNAMPESVTDRLSTRYEHLFLLTKSRRYWFDLDPIREQPKRIAAGPKDIEWVADTPWNHNRLGEVGNHDAGRNPGDVWEIATAPFPGAHFAAFPPELPRRCILAGCKPGGTVLDPFHGSGTTGMVAQKLGRRYVGIDINAEYLDLSLRTRLANAALPFDGEAS